jgi:hypothetical protein
MATRFRILGVAALSPVAAACVWFFLAMGDVREAGGAPGIRFVLAVIGGLGVGVATLLRVWGGSFIGCVVGGLLGFAAMLVCCSRELLTGDGETRAWAWFGTLVITASSAAGGFFLGMGYGLIR